MQSSTYETILNVNLSSLGTKSSSWFLGAGPSTSVPIQQSGRKSTGVIQAINIPGFLLYLQLHQVPRTIHLLKYPPKKGEANSIFFQ